MNSFKKKLKTKESDLFFPAWTQTKALESAYGLLICWNIFNFSSTNSSIYLPTTSKSTTTNERITVATTEKKRTNKSIYGFCICETHRCDVFFFSRTFFLFSFNASASKLDWHKLSRQIYSLSIVVVKQQRQRRLKKQALRLMQLWNKNTAEYIFRWKSHWSWNFRFIYCIEWAPKKSNVRFFPRLLHPKIIQCHVIS